jgi:sugar lactone lactonase YvrE
MRRTILAAVVALGLLAVATPASARAVDYDLPNAGVLLEGIGVDSHNGVFYVSGVNDGGDVYRGRLGQQQLERWVDGTGTTGRGIDVDDAGRVFVAGGPSGAVRVFDRSGTLLTTLATGAANSFLNDVWVDRDGSVYVSDSSLPKIWRITTSAGGSWAISEWLDVSASITYTPSLADFDLGGIVVDGDILLTSQGTTGQLWRIDLHTKQISEVDLGGTRIVNADGIVLRGRTLWVVQNFSRQITEIRLRRQATAGEVLEVTPTPANRTLTTAKLVRGDLLAVDSQFGFNAAAAPAVDRVLSLHP